MVELYEMTLTECVREKKTAGIQISDTDHSGPEQSNENDQQRKWIGENQQSEHVLGYLKEGENASG